MFGRWYTLYSILIYEIYEVILMTVIAVVGSQWGDEGKGKMTDYLSQSADMTVRSKAIVWPALLPPYNRFRW